jgi:endonuclease YncB( thermonuclease family)
MSRHARWFLSLFLVLVALSQVVQAHRDSCHRYHRCPSDHGTYVCGDLRQCSQCPDNDYCLNHQPRQQPHEASLPPRPSSTTIAPREQWTGEVVGLTDGDTFDILRDGKSVRVRLYGIDTPESKQAFGTRARQFSSDLVFRQTVTVTVRDTDQYGRPVVDVRVPDGRNLNEELVRTGMAWWYRAYAPNETNLAQLEAQAREANRGLWADLEPIPPWQWRKKRR